LQTSEALLRIRKTAEYQFGRGVGEVLFPDSVTVAFSKKTGRVRHVFLDDKLLGTLRPTDGMFSLTIQGAKRIAAHSKVLRHWVRVDDDVVSFIAEGRSVFAKHVTDADVEIRPMEEVIVLDGKGGILAVGRAVLTGPEMKAFRRGVAVKVRRGVKEES